MTLYNNILALYCTELPGVGYVGSISTVFHFKLNTVKLSKKQAYFTQHHPSISLQHCQNLQMTVKVTKGHRGGERTDGRRHLLVPVGLYMRETKQK